MKLFFDTSALIKFFHKETGTEKVRKLILDESNLIIISELAAVEFYSAVFRRFRNKEITSNELETALAGFEETIQDFTIEPVTHSVYEKSKNLIKENGNSIGLRTLDSIHLSTYLLLSENDWHFVCSDEILCNLIKSLKIPLINPIY